MSFIEIQDARSRFADLMAEIAGKNAIKSFDYHRINALQQGRSELVERVPGGLSSVETIEDN